MTELKDFYVGKIGQDSDEIKKTPRYLSLLALDGAIEIDNYLLKRNHDFGQVQELAGILEKYQLKDIDTALTEPNFPYLTLWRAVIKNSDKNIRHISELALEMRLLRSELEVVPANSKRLEELRSLLCNFSRECSKEQEQYQHPRSCF